MEKVKKNKKYVYDYPENRELAKGLQNGDNLIIAIKTGLSEGYISQVLSGKRKMKPSVRLIVERLVEVNKMKMLA